MGKLFYQKLAAQNIRRNARTYIPYILTCMGTIAMFFICLSLSTDPGIRDMQHGSEAIGTILAMGTIVVGLFSVIFLFYTNSFLIKRRKKELGLYNVLGMGKRHIARVLTWESVFVFLISIVLGLGGGVLFNQLVYLLLLKIMDLPAKMQFTFNGENTLSTLLLFAGIFLLILLHTLRQIQVVNPVELLKAGQTGEREPKTKWILTIIGVIALGTGYGIALTAKNPLAALNLFFVAVILVIIGTYCLFTAGSIALLKALRKNKNYYYQPKHFVGVSGMIYRMKQNAVGLANICILSTAVLVMISSTAALYMGMEDVITTRYPYDIALEFYELSEAEVPTLRVRVEQLLERKQIPVTDAVDSAHVAVTVQEVDGVMKARDDVYSNSSTLLRFMTITEYNRIQNASDTLKDGDAYLYTVYGENPKDDTLAFGDIKLRVTKQLDSLNIDGELNAYLVNSHVIIVSDEQVIQNIWKQLEVNPKEPFGLTYSYLFDTSLEPAEQQEFISDVYDEIKNWNAGGFRYDSKADGRASFYSMYGTLFFLGIFLGILFLMATVLIMYYKQISEGYEDKARYRIMRNVGMTKQEIKGSIRSQVLTVFFLPLVTAIIHIAVAFPVITKLLAVLNLRNIPLFLTTTVASIILFAIFYAVTYALTARAYYRTVN